MFGFSGGLEGDSDTTYLSERSSMLKAIDCSVSTTSLWHWNNTIDLIAFARIIQPASLLLLTKSDQVLASAAGDYHDVRYLVDWS